MAYLVEWAYALVGRSGASMAGLLPLSNQEIRAWAANNHITPTRYEVQALMALDAVIRDPDEAHTVGEGVEDGVARLDTPWPEAKDRG